MRGKRVNFGRSATQCYRWVGVERSRKGGLGKVGASLGWVTGWEEIRACGEVMVWW